MSDPYRLQRFIDAQDAAGTYDRALAELRAGRKRTHWMWFIFPQVAGLGHSATAREFAISSLDEAAAYLEHPVLGSRLVECTSSIVHLQGKTAEGIFGGIDAKKLRSSMTLFSQADPDEEMFTRALEIYFDGRPDEATLSLLA